MGNKEARTDGGGEPLPCPGNVVLPAVFLFPGEGGHSVPAPMVGQMLKDGETREGHSGEDVGHQKMGLGKGQKGFF